jgi:predicted PolB exonuclease-like 3'-5' exonuclease
LGAEEIKYLVFDVESVPDGALIKKVRYPSEIISEDEAIQLFMKEISDSTGGVSEFIPVTFQYPVAICVAKVRADFSLADIVCLDEPDYRTREMVKMFWFGIEDIYNDASFVTFNGRGFDIPILELMAYRYGFTAKRHFKDKFAGRFRFGTKHIDLQDWISNYSAIKMNGGLNKGNEVYGLFKEGRIKDINDYCIHDVLDTYFVFLRTRVMIGELSLAKEQELVKKTKKYIEDNLEKIPAMKEYYDNWGDWDPWPV